MINLSLPLLKRHCFQVFFHTSVVTNVASYILNGNSSNFTCLFITICRITYSVYLYSSFIRLFKKKSFCLFLIFEYFCEKFACIHNSSYFLKKNPSKLCMLPYYTMNICIMLQQFDRGLFIPPQTKCGGYIGITLSIRPCTL